MLEQLLIPLFLTALVAGLIAVIGIVCRWVVLEPLRNWRFGKSTTRPFLRTVLRRIIIMSAGAFALAVFMEVVGQVINHSHATTQATIARNKVRIGMTINDVLPLVHGMNVTASAVVDFNKVAYYAPDEFRLVQHDDGTFTFSGYWGTQQVSGNLTQSQAHERMTKPEQVLENLTEFQAAEQMKQPRVR